MANFLSGFLDNVGSGLTQPKGNLGDFAHAARLYNDQSFRLMPKVKFLYHVVFNINPNAIKSSSFRQQHINTINLLVKSADLPKFKIEVETKNQYNRVKNVQTKINYDPVNIVFHDDNLGVTTQMWSMYYGYYFADSGHGGSAGSGSGAAGLSGLGMISSAVNMFAPGAGKLLGAATSLLGAATGAGATEASVPAAYKQNTYLGADRNGFQYGLDNGSAEPFFSSIQIFQMGRHEYQAFTLINPVINSWQHDTMSQGSDGDVVQSTMNISYEAVFYGKGSVSEGTPKGFGTQYYDKSPSPLSILGGGTRSLFGQGGVLGGIGDIVDSIASGKAFSDPRALFGTLIKGANVIRNAKSLTAEGIRQESYGIVKNAIGAVTGVNVSGVANIAFPKTGGTGQSQTTTALPPVENYSTSVVNATSFYQQAINQNPTAGVNLITTVARNAGIAGLPYTPTAYNNLSSTQKTAVIAKIVDEYEKGNPKVVNITNKFSTTLNLGRT